MFKAETDLLIMILVVSSRQHSDAELQQHTEIVIYYNLAYCPCNLTVFVYLLKFFFNCLDLC